MDVEVRVRVRVTHEMFLGACGCIRAAVESDVLPALAFMAVFDNRNRICRVIQGPWLGPFLIAITHAG